MLKYSNGVLLLSLIYTLTHDLAWCDDNLFVTMEEVPEPGSNASVAGPPGPVGLVGLPGPKGTTGRIGTCQCDIKRVRRHNDMMEKFKAILYDFKDEETLFHFKQNPDSCSVGMKTGKLPNSAITASSFHSEKYAPFLARLDNVVYERNNTGTWLPAQGNDVNWIQVDLIKPKKITGVITQGYHRSDLWTSSYKISYSNRSDDRAFVNDGEHVKIFTGNHDRTTYKINLFSKPITARYFRLYVVTYQRLVVLRMELLTC